MLPKMRCGDCVAGDVTLLEEIWDNSVQVIEVQNYTGAFIPRRGLDIKYRFVSDVSVVGALQLPGKI